MSVYASLSLSPIRHKSTFQSTNQSINQSILMLEHSLYFCSIVKIIQYFLFTNQIFIICVCHIHCIKNSLIQTSINFSILRGIILVDQYLKLISGGKGSPQFCFLEGYKLVKVLVCGFKISLNKFWSQHGLQQRKNEQFII